MAGDCSARRVLGIVRGHALGWTSAPALASLTVGALLLVAFFAW